MHGSSIGSIYARWLGVCALFIKSIYALSIGSIYDLGLEKAASLFNTKSIYALCRYYARAQYWEYIRSLAWSMYAVYKEYVRSFHWEYLRSWLGQGTLSSLRVFTLFVRSIYDLSIGRIYALRLEYLRPL